MMMKLNEKFFLIERISVHTNTQLIIPNRVLIEFKEALVFAFLGVLRYRNEVNCLASVTGAPKNNCGGQIFLSIIRKKWMKNFSINLYHQKKIL
jgi:1,6-anhydro-N-acetylmuramate kinase